MFLILRVETYRSAPVATPLERKFGMDGGTIGRSSDNDLVLEDPDKLISRAHARIEFRDGNFLLQDVGSNPSVLNGKPLGGSRQARLTHGDDLAVGEYVLSVIEQAEAPVSAAAPVAPVAAGTTLDDLLGAPGVAPLPDPLARPPGLDKLQIGSGPADDPLGLSGPLVPNAGPLADVLFGGASIQPAPGYTGSMGTAAAPESLPFATTPIGIPADYDPFADLGQGGHATAAVEQKPSQISATHEAPVVAPVLLPEFTILGRSGSVSQPVVQTPPVQQAPQAPLAAEALQMEQAPLAEGAPQVPQTPLVPDAPHVQQTPPAPDVRQAPQPPQVQAAPQVAPASQTRSVLSTPQAQQSQPAPQPRATAPATTAPATPTSNDDAVFQALLKGLGVPDLPRGSRSATDLAELVGQMLREALGGTIDVLMARALTKKEIRIDMTVIGVRDNNPLKFFPDVDSALTQMLSGRGAGYLPPLKAIWASFDDIKAHELAMVAGMRAALLDVLKRFDPAAIEQRVAAPSVMDKMLGGNRKARMWDRQVEMYDEMVREADDDFQRLFGERFASAYEDQIGRMRTK
ncbi:MAG TPA: type VI secretion system-associated FHA domain protein TagH [Paraburkholderia sp.]